MVLFVLRHVYFKAEKTFRQQNGFPMVFLLTKSTHVIIRTVPILAQLSNYAPPMTTLPLTSHYCQPYLIYVCVNDLSFGTMETVNQTMYHCSPVRILSDHDHEAFIGLLNDIGSVLCRMPMSYCLQEH